MSRKFAYLANCIKLKKNDAKINCLARFAALYGLFNLSTGSPPPTAIAMCTNILFIILISCSSMSNQIVRQNTSYRRRFNYFPDVSSGKPSGDGRLGGGFIVYVWVIKWFRQLYNYNCRLSCQSSATQGDDQIVI